jgi:hypothetical protein
MQMCGIESMCVTNGLWNRIYVWNRYLFNRRKNMDQDGGPVRVSQSQRLYLNVVDDVLFEKDKLESKDGETCRRGACVDLSSYTYQNDKYPHTSYTAVPPTTAHSLSRSESTNPSSLSECRDRLLSGANSTSPSTSRSPTQRKKNHVKDESDAASSHRKKDSGHAEGMGDAIEKGSSGGNGFANDAAVNETNKSTRSKFMDSVSNVMNRGRPNKESRQARKSSGLPIL